MKKEKTLQEIKSDRSMKNVESVRKRYYSPYGIVEADSQEEAENKIKKLKEARAKKAETEKADKAEKAEADE